MSNLVDSHIYVCKPIILKLISELAQFNNIVTDNFKDEFLPSMVRYQYNDNIKDIIKSINDQDNENVSFVILILIYYFINFLSILYYLCQAFTKLFNNRYE